MELSSLNLKQYIGGKWVTALNGKTWNVINPATEEIIAAVPYGDGSDCEAAIQSAEKGFKVWSKMNAFERCGILKRAAALMHERLEKYATLTVMESGKPLAEAIGEWRVAANFFEWYAEEGKRSYGTVIPAARNNKRMSVIHQPIGVVGAITAWNFPSYNPARCWSAALGAGCSVVAKASEYTPLTAMLMTQCLHDAGIPEGVMNLVNGIPEDIGNSMLGNNAVRKISFTGSTRVGKILMDGASRTHTRLSLELGGNAPVIIFPDINIEQVAQESVVAKLRNAGQVCIAPQRYLVHSDIADKFIEAASEKIKSIQLGNGLDPKTEMGPIINQPQHAGLSNLLQQSIQAGAEVICGGNTKPIEKGYFFEPTLIRNQQIENPIFQKEIFGPIMPVTTFKTPEEAVSLANATQYGLAAYIWTNDLRTATRTSEQVEFGLVGINEWHPQALEAPFGGWKQSGLGYECGSEGLAEYQEKKLISTGGL
jgi:hypothetical protein